MTRKNKWLWQERRRGYDKKKEEVMTRSTYSSSICTRLSRENNYPFDYNRFCKLSVSLRLVSSNYLANSHEPAVLQERKCQTMWQKPRVQKLENKKLIKFHSRTDKRMQCLAFVVIYCSSLAGSYLFAGVFQDNGRCCALDSRFWHLPSSLQTVISVWPCSLRQ